MKGMNEMMNRKIKKAIKYSIALMVVGFAIGCIGLGMLGFKKDKLTKKKGDPWYYTVNYTEGEGWTAALVN